MAGNQYGCIHCGKFYIGNVCPCTWASVRAGVSIVEEGNVVPDVENTRRKQLLLLRRSK